MPAPGNADYKVEIVDSSGAADMTVAVVGDQVVDLTGATDGQVLTVQADGTVAPEAPAADPAAVPKSLYDANTVLKADTDNTPAALTMGASTILARLAAGAIKAATPAELKTLLAIAESDVTGLVTDLAGKAPARTTLHFPSRLFTTGLGTAAFSGGTSSPPRFLLDAASSESIAGVLEVPQGWTTMDVELWWCNDGAGSGAVVWRFDYLTYADGENWGAADTSAANVTDTAGVANVGVTTTIATAVPVVAGAPMKVEIVRIATDVADTLGNDAAVVSVKFIKAS